MVELIRTNDVVFLSALRAELSARGINSLVLDAFTSVAEGSLGILPRRLMIDEGDATVARRILAEFQEDHAGQ